MNCLVCFGIIVKDINLTFDIIDRKFGSRDKTYSDRIYSRRNYVWVICNQEKLLSRCFSIVWNNFTY